MSNYGDNYTNGQKGMWVFVLIVTAICLLGEWLFGWFK